MKTKYIIILIIVLAIVAVLIFNDHLGINIGSIFAAVTGGFAAFRAKLFKNSPTLSEQISEVENEHAVKREEWTRLKEEYESKYAALKARMDYIDYKSAIITSEIKELDEFERKALQRNRQLSDEEILDRLRNL
jgi:hypothetical protein